MSWFDDGANWLADSPLGSLSGTGLLANAFGFGDKGPKPPDFNALADKQTQANRPNINTPFGSQAWSRDAQGNWTMNSKLNPALQGASNGLMGQLQGAMGSPLENTDAARQHAEDAVYQRHASRLDPMFAQREQSQRAMLANQGLDPSSEAFRNEMDTFNRGRNDAYGSAMNDSIAAGGQEATRSLIDALRRREAPLQELSQMQGFGQMPGFGSAGDYFGAGRAGYQSDLDQWNAGQARKQNATNGIMNMGKLFAMGG